MKNFFNRLEKIKSIEAQLKAGKTLSEEQKALVPLKASIEKSVTDLESVKIQIEEIAREVDDDDCSLIVMF